MTAAELIKHLQKFPPETEVWIDHGDGFGEGVGYTSLGFVTDPIDDGWRGTIWPDVDDFDDVEADEKYKIIVLG